VPKKTKRSQSDFSNNVPLIFEHTSYTLRRRFVNDRNANRQSFSRIVRRARLDDGQNDDIVRELYRRRRTNTKPTVETKMERNADGNIVRNATPVKRSAFRRVNEK